MQNIWLIVTALIAIFLCGSGSGYVFGALGERRKLETSLEPKTSESWSDEALGALQKRLSLTPEQLGQLKPIIASTGDKITRERERALLQIHLNILKIHDDVRPFLTPSQKNKLEMSREKLVETIALRFSPLIGGAGVPNAKSPPAP